LLHSLGETPALPDFLLSGVMGRASEGDCLSLRLSPSMGRRLLLVRRRVYSNCQGSTGVPGVGPQRPFKMGEACGGAVLELGASSFYPGKGASSSGRAGVGEKGGRRVLVLGLPFNAISGISRIGGGAVW